MLREELYKYLTSVTQDLDYINDIPEGIWNTAVLKEIPPRKVNARKGELIHFVDILIEGHMRVLNEFESGKLYSFAYLTPPAYIGSFEVIAERETYTATTEAQTECRIIRLKRKEFTRWFQYSAPFARDVAYRMAVNVCRESYTHGDVLYYPSAYIIGEYLTEMFDSQKSQNLRILTGRQEIAEQLGLSVRTVNRCLKKFRDNGLIATDKGKIVINRSCYRELKKHNVKIRQEF